MKIKILLITTLLISFFSFSQKSNREDKTGNKELIYKELKEDELVTINQEHTPPLAPSCKSKWDNEKKKKSLSKFISMHVNRNLNLDLAQQEDIKGLVRLEIKFVIDKEGFPINITATGGPGIINRDAINVINNLPKLEPATINGKPVNVEYKLAVAFMVR